MTIYMEQQLRHIIILLCMTALCTLNQLAHQIKSGGLPHQRNLTMYNELSMLADVILLFIALKWMVAVILNNTFSSHSGSTSIKFTNLTM